MVIISSKILLFFLLILSQLSVIISQFSINSTYYESECASLLNAIYSKSSTNSISKSYSKLCGFPIALNAYQATFYLLEASFPFNAPRNIRKRAGQEFRSTVAAHAAIGITLETNNGCSPNSIPTKKNFNPICEQFSIEFAAENYTEALFNNNNASIYVTYPLDTERWISSKILTTTTGYVYTEYILKLLHNISIGYYDIYQPILIVYPNQTTFQNLYPVTQNVLGGDGSGLLNYPRSSYSFINETITFLIGKDCLITPLLQLSSTYLIYFSNTPSLKEPVSLYDKDVQQWYANLSDCYMTVASFSINAAFFFNNITTCYSDNYAYVNVGDGSPMVYKVNLYPQTDNIYTPMLFRFLIPSEEFFGFLSTTLNGTDIFIFCIICITMAAYCCFLVRQFTRSKTSASHKEMEGRFIDRIYETYGNDGTLKEWNITLNSKPSSIIHNVNRISQGYRSTRGNSTEEINLGLLNRGDTS